MQLSKSTSDCSATSTSGTGPASSYDVVCVRVTNMISVFSIFVYASLAIKGRTHLHIYAINLIVYFRTKYHLNLANFLTYSRWQGLEAEKADSMCEQKTWN